MKKVSEMKKQEKTERTKARILNAAMQEFGEKGYLRTTVNAICTHYHIPKGLLYHNFAGKDELYLICVERCFSELISYLQPHAIAEIETYLELRFQYFARNPLYARLFFEAVLQPPEGLAEQIKKSREAFDCFNRQTFHVIPSRMKLREGVTEADAMEYYELMMELFNGYFSGMAKAGQDFNKLITEHEKKLAKMLDFMLYGTVERGMLLK